MINPSDWPLDPYTVDGVTLAQRLNDAIPSEFDALKSGKANLAGGNSWGAGTQTFASGTLLCGDMDNATLSNRLRFSPSAASAVGSLLVSSSGAADGGAFLAYARSDVNNSEFMQILSQTGGDTIRSGATGTFSSSYRPLNIYQNNRIAMQFDSLGQAYLFSQADAYAGTLFLQNTSGSQRRVLRLNGSDLEIVNQGINGIPQTFTNGGDIICTGAFRNQYQGGGEAQMRHSYDAGSGAVGSLLIETSRNINVGISYFPTGGIASFTPGGDNIIHCGWGFGRWAMVWAVNGTIQTSDAREKTPVRSFNEAELAVAMSLADDVGFYKWLSEINEKGDDAVWMCGQTAQFIRDRFEEHGLDVLEYGILLYEDYTPYADVKNADGEPLIPEGSPKDRWSANYSNLNQFLIRGLRENQKRIEARLTALESK